MSYARARLWLGITGVGTIVMICALLLLFHVPSRYLSTSTSYSQRELSELLAILCFFLALSAPFDFLGGFLLPKKYGRAPVGFTRFLRRWLRGVLLQSGLFVGFSFVLLSAGRSGGPLLVLGAFCGIQLLLLLTQALLAQWIGTIHYSKPHVFEGLRYRVASGAAGYFTGGIAGVPGREELILPARWQELFAPEQLHTVFLRKIGTLRSGSRTRGVLLAFGWNLAGFSLALILSHGMASLAQLVTFSLWFTLWSFLGLLLLPVPSQRGVFLADRYALQNGSTEVVLEAVIRRLDLDQDDEYSRPALVERYFHPLPSVERRLQSLASTQTGFNAWQAARMAIYLSLGGLSFLCRAVHCNSGRPEAWVFLPSD